MLERLISMNLIDPETHAWIGKNTRNHSQGSGIKMSRIIRDNNAYYQSGLMYQNKGNSSKMSTSIIPQQRTSSFGIDSANFHSSLGRDSQRNTQNVNNGSYRQESDRSINEINRLYRQARNQFKIRVSNNRQQDSVRKSDLENLSLEDKIIGGYYSRLQLPEINS